MRDIDLENNVKTVLLTDAEAVKLIAGYCKRIHMTEGYFGTVVATNPHLVPRLRKGGSIKLSRLHDALDFIVAHPYGKQSVLGAPRKERHDGSDHRRQVSKPDKAKLKNKGRGGKSK